MTLPAEPAPLRFEPLGDDVPPALRGLSLLRVERAGPVLHVRLNRPAKRNSINDELLAQLHTVWLHMARLAPEVKAAVISGEGAHFCAGLDLSEVSERSVTQAVHHSRSWHACFDAIQYGPVPVVAVLHGAVVGGGLELASSAHIRVAEASTFYGLPEGTRGIFVGGGGSVRISRLIGVARMTDMMLTGRVFDAAEGQQHAISNYLVADGAGLAQGLELAQKIAGNTALSNYAITQALPRIADLSASDGLFMEALMASIAQSDEEAKERVQAFLDKRAGKVAKS